MKKSFKNGGKMTTNMNLNKLLVLTALSLIFILSVNDVFAQAPAAPVIKPATAVRNDRFTANWETAANASGYYLDVATDVGFTQFVTGFNNLDVGDASQRVVTGLITNTQYYYRLRAYNSSGTSASSDSAAVITGPDVPLAKAATLVTQLNFVAHWDSVATAANYYLDIATDSLFNNFVTNYNNRNIGTNNKHTVDSTLTPNTIYYYRVRAGNTFGMSNNSKFIIVRTLPYPPAAPANLISTNLQVGKVILNWVNTTNSEIGFKIERSTTGQTGFTQIDTAVAGSTSYRDNSVAENMTYDYRVKAYNKYFESDYSNVTSITTLFYDVNPPTNLSATAVQLGKIMLHWSDNSNNEVGFNIERKLVTAVSWAYIDRISSNNTTYIDNTVSPNTTYNYRVSAFNFNTVSGYSNIVAVTSISTTLKAPSSLSATAPSAGWVVLSWIDNTTTETGFTVERKLSTETNFAAIGSVAKDATTYWDNTTSPKKTYDYRVKAVSGTIESDYSNVASVTTKPLGIAKVGIPTQYSLDQNFPNPFNPSTRIQFSLPRTGLVKLTIYNLLGEIVKVLVNEEMPAGYYYEDFDGTKLPSGIYVYSIRTNEYSQTRKMIMLK